jgi:hypothetical protein
MAEMKRTGGPVSGQNDGTLVNVDGHRASPDESRRDEGLGSIETNDVCRTRRLRSLRKNMTTCRSCQERHQRVLVGVARSFMRPGMPRELCPRKNPTP